MLAWTKRWPFADESQVIILLNFACFYKVYNQRITFTFKNIGGKSKETVCNIES